jgi:fluoroquinolone transport system permease protein
MKVLAVAKELNSFDLKMMLRDPWLKFLIAIPLVVAFLARVFYPEVFRWVSELIEIDTMQFYEALMGFVMLITVPNCVGGVVGFLLLDQKDDGTLLSIQVTPFSLRGYLAYRLLVPMLVGVPLTFVMFPIAGFDGVGLSALVLACIASAPLTPAFALFMAVVAANKVQGLAAFKVIGIVFLPPFIAYFVDSRWEYAFWILPTYWPAKFYWTALEEGRTDMAYFFITLFFGLATVWGLMKLFERVMTRR